MNETAASSGPVNGASPGAAPNHAERVPTGAPPVLGIVTGFFRSTSAKIGAAATAVLIAAVPVWLQPLVDTINDSLWQEEIGFADQIPVSGREHIEQNLSIALQPKTRAGLSGGTIQVSSPDGTIAFAGQTPFSVEASKGAVTVPAPGQLKFTPNAAGTHFIRVVLTTNNGRTFTSDLKIVVTGAETSLYSAQSRVWTGKWHIALDRVQGVMDLAEDRNQHLSGTAEFRDGENYAIAADSWHDGTSFLIYLNGVRKRFVVQGFPCLVTDDQQRKARVLNGRADITAGSNGVRKQVRLGAIVQQCPDMAKNLSETPGDGIFEAFTILQ
jgi:hypothetical protein